MERLSLGSKIQVDKREMKKLTSKNYSNLPEIKQKATEEQKRLEALKRKQIAAQYGKELDAKRRA